MKFKIKRQSAFTLVELLVSISVVCLCLGALASFCLFASHSFTALFNYTDLNNDNRNTVDQLQRDVRQSNRVKSATTNSIVLEDSSLVDLTYFFSPTLKTLTRTRSGVNTVLLRNCDSFSLRLYQRDMTSTTIPDDAKVVDVSWSCSRKVLGKSEDTESVQSARIVIRKQ